MLAALISLAGLALLALAWWWRQPRRGGRWWTSGGFPASAALIGVPGIGLALAMAWPMSLVSGGNRVAAFAVVPFAVGLVGALWTGLFLPTPRWVRPRWWRR